MIGPDPSVQPLKTPAPDLETSKPALQPGQLSGFAVKQEPASAPKASQELHWSGNVRAALKSLFERLMNVEPARAVLSRVLTKEGDFVFKGIRLVQLLGEPDYAKQFEKAIKKGLGDQIKPQWALQLAECRAKTQEALSKGQIRPKDAQRLTRSFANVLVDRLFADKSEADIYGAIPVSGLIWLFGKDSHALGRHEAAPCPEGYTKMQAALEAKKSGGSASLELYLPLPVVIDTAKSAIGKGRFRFEGVQLLAALAGGVPPSEEGLNHLERFLQAGSHPLDGAPYRELLVGLYQDLQALKRS